MRPKWSMAGFESVGDSQRTKRLSKRTMAFSRIRKNASISGSFSGELTERVC
jgi:hypothetical protein